MSSFSPSSGGGSGGGEQNLGSSGGGPKDVPFDMDALLAQELGQR